MAEGFARKLGGAAVEAWSAGSRPSGKVNETAVALMKEKGVDLSVQTSKGLLDLPAGPWDAVVTMGCGDACPNIAAKRRLDWALPDPKALPPEGFRQVRDAIEARVAGLLKELAPPKRLNLFERYLTAWVGLCMLAGVALGKAAPGAVDALRRMEFGTESRINVPIAVLLWLMIYPMMLKVDFGSVLGVGRKPKGLLVTAAVNWLVKPFSMALLGWVFFKHLFSPWIGPELADQYVAGVIILAAAPCTAMVFVWSYLVDGDPAYTLVQVALNDLIMLVAFAPIVKLLVGGASSLTVPFGVLLWAVFIFIVVPLSAGAATRAVLVARHGRAWFEESFLPRFHSLSVTALLATLTFIFAFQAENITGRFLHVALIAVPILLQVYFNAGLVYSLMRLLKVEFPVAAPGALIGASNFFELAVATAIALFGPDSGAALATVVGVLVEVPVMLSVCGFCNRTRGWFAEAA
ncbi:ACR3 family arsenite efflux transporter [bacterium]|nr:MAG: ACR3 family arsenite efflux transporter [bacterium]